MIYLKIMLALMLVVWATGLVQAWDLGVVTRTQIKLFSNKSTNKTIDIQLECMDKAAYDHINKHIYVSDSCHERGSIFRIKTTGNKAFNNIETIVAKQTGGVGRMTFDYLTSTLYWTTLIEHNINYVHVPNDEIMVPLNGKVLLTLDIGFPKGIAIDVHRKYLYWAKFSLVNSTIERSHVNGSDREVLVYGDLVKPRAVVLDAEIDRLYLLDNGYSMNYSIQSIDLRDTRNRRTLVQGEDFDPLAIAVDDRYVYWNDWKSLSVWKIPKNSSRRNISPTLVSRFTEFDLPLELFVLSGGDSSAELKDMHLNF